MPDVTELLIWEAFPFEISGPEIIEARRGQAEGIEVVVLWNPVNQKHVDILAKNFDEKPEACMKTALRSLQGYNEEGFVFSLK